MKYYQTVTASTSSDDEWVYYDGYDREKALEQREYENAHNGKGYIAEVREYDIPDGKTFEDLDDDEVCEVLSCWKVVGGYES